ncbi:MAG TPA: putative oxidoreductase C-terminal domain-containing protein [Bryobacteraceae bacterium]|nr:putative oxidoreductase C-terminal domain-containing protein [Bryobacteraceae bacterium]
MVLDPGHFHAALLQKEMLEGVSDTVNVYAPLGPDLLAHLGRIAAFNSRAEQPTHWRSRIYAAPDYFERMLAERPGNVVVLSGRNLGKMDAIERALQAGIHVLADKPWIIDAGELPKLEAALRLARGKRLAAYDIMTQRYEITNILLRELVRDRAVFGEPASGTVEEPAATMESVHHLLKLVAGQPNLRPAWFFDIRQQGEGLADIGTHLVDLVQWILCERPIDYRRDIQVLAATRRPTVLTAEQFRRVTGETRYPAFLESAVRSGSLEYFCNNRVDYTLNGIHTRLEIRWDFEAPPGGGDTETSIFRGSRSRIEVRQGREENFQPEVYVIPARASEASAIRAALVQRFEQLRADYPGLQVDGPASRLHVVIPAGLRDGHEQHFASVARQFQKYVREPASMPLWEDAAMAAKYYTTTRGVELARSAAR